MTSSSKPCVLRDALKMSEAHRTAKRKRLLDVYGLLTEHVRAYERRGLSVPDDLRGRIEGFCFVLGSTIPEDSLHDAGAFAWCSHCARYSASAFSLAHTMYTLWCDCGRSDGWRERFARPTLDSRWSITSRRSNNGGESYIP